MGLGLSQVALPQRAARTEPTVSEGTDVRTDGAVRDLGKSSSIAAMGTKPASGDLVPQS